MKNFKQSEFHCPCGKCNKKDITPEFQAKMDLLREKLGKPISITSGVRCPDHNKAVGGVPNSQHVMGIAADISTAKYSSTDKYNLVKYAIELGFGGIGVGSSFIHVDIRTANTAIWSYGSGGD
jgi:zinc D-Ala-D-Ala carboxypeptidase